MNTSWLDKLSVMGMPALAMIFVVSLLISALVLSVVFRIFLGHWPSYLRSISVVLLTAATAAAVQIIGNMLWSGHLAGWLALLAAWLVGASWINSRLLTSTGLQVGYGKASLIQLIYLVISSVLWMLFVATLAV